MSDLDEFIKNVNKGIAVEVDDNLDYDSLVSLIGDLRVSWVKLLPCGTLLPAVI